MIALDMQDRHVYQRHHKLCRRGGDVYPLVPKP